MNFKSPWTESARGQTDCGIKDQGIIATTSKKIKKSYTECLKCGLPIHFQVHAATKKMTITLIFLRFNIHVPISKTPTEIIPAKVFRVPHDKITR